MWAPQIAATPGQNLCDVRMSRELKLPLPTHGRCRRHLWACYGISQPCRTQRTHETISPVSEDSNPESASQHRLRVQGSSAISALRSNLALRDRLRELLAPVELMGIDLPDEASSLRQEVQFTEASTVEQMIVDAAHVSSWAYTPGPKIPRNTADVFFEPWVREALILLNPE